MITIDAAKLRELLAGAVTDNKCPKEGYRYVLFEMGEGVLRATSTDAETTVVMEVEADGSAAPFAIEFAPLKGLVSNMSGDVVITEEDQPRCLVKCGRSRYHINTLPVEQFPNIDHLEAMAVEFSPAAFKEALETVRYAAAKLDARNFLNGIHIKQNQAIAANGVILAMAPVPVALADDVVVIIPTSGVAHILPRLGDDATFELMSNSRGVVAVRFGIPIDQVTVVLVDARSPDFDRAATNGDEFMVVVDAKVMKLAIDRISPFCQKGFVDFKLTDEGLIIHSRDEQAREVIPVIESRGGVDVSITDQHISKVLALASGGNVRWQGQNQADASRPNLFTFDGRCDEHYVAGVAR